MYWCDAWGGDGVFLIRDDGSDAPGVRLTTNPFRDQGDEDPEVSTDGQTVTFVRHKVGGKLQALFAVDIGGAEPRQLTSYEREVAITHDWGARWTADHDHHECRLPPSQVPERGDDQVRRVPPADANPLQRRRAGRLRPHYSPNGRWIVFRIENAEKERFQLYRMHPDGTHRQLIKKLPIPPRQSDWGSD